MKIEMKPINCVVKDEENRDYKDAIIQFLINELIKKYFEQRRVPR